MFCCNLQRLLFYETTVFILGSWDRCYDFKLPFKIAVVQTAALICTMWLHRWLQTQQWKPLLLSVDYCVRCELNLLLHMGHQNGLGSLRPEVWRQQVSQRGNRLSIHGKHWFLFSELTRNISQCVPFPFLKMVTI